jgi:hypothetical protein
MPFGYSVHIGLRTMSITVPSSIGAFIVIGTMPEPIIVESVGRNRSPSAPVGRRLRKTIRTGLSLLATMVGPRYWGGVTA